VTEADLSKAASRLAPVTVKALHAIRVYREKVVAVLMLTRCACALVHVGSLSLGVMSEPEQGLVCMAGWLSESCVRGWGHLDPRSPQRL